MYAVEGIGMPSASLYLHLTHTIGLALGVGCATAKLMLLLKCKADRDFLPVYLEVSKPVTRLIVLGIVLLTLSGAGMMLVGYLFTARLIVKLSLVAAMWVIGPVIDKILEPKFRQMAPKVGEPASAAFVRIERRYLLAEAVATGLFYVIVALWMLGS